ncbi:MAG TPA: glycerol-3-phosphate 1-O-acyltransferase [Candidatus Limnocylindrales bacterium]|nr:glycerol-3-phosphate 1-O-acyltransferase [Candidatus Limnocylindrales bacterium]
MSLAALSADTGSIEPPWPSASAERIVFLLDACTELERRLLKDWIARQRPGEFPDAAVDVVSIPPTRGPARRRRGSHAALESAVASGGDPLMAPLRVAWFSGKTDGLRTLSTLDMLTMSDPRDPGRVRQRWTIARHPERCRVVAGEPARLSELRARWRSAGGEDIGETTGLAEFIARQATLALERAERRLRGARYKVPRMVEQDILGRPAFRGGLARLARELGKPEAKVAEDAQRYLREIAATHDPFVIDVVAFIIRSLYRRGYGDIIHYDKKRLEQIYSLAQRHPVVFLPTHKSNLDHLVLQYVLHENGHPPNHTAGGINMNFFPVGPLVRRAGVFFIRRTFKDNPVYKFVLRHYIDYLIEKRFSLEWYIEGGRSRSGKMLPPRFGMLAYVVDAWRRGKSEDVVLLPVAIAYDQIQDVGEYVAEQRGSAKESESFGWFLRVIRRLRRRYGGIHIEFGEPISLNEQLGERGTADTAEEIAENSLDLQKLAFEVCFRINKATPITPTSLVTLALLGVGDRALTVEETVAALTNLVAYVRRRKLPMTEDLDLTRPDSVQRVLEHLVENGVVTCFAEGADAVYAIRSDEYLTAAYYRNTIIHFFVTGSIAELAVVAAAEAGAGDRLELFWNEAMALRDLLKFEFFFADRATFRAEMSEEMAFHDPEWESRLRAGGKETEQLLLSIKPFNSHRVLRPFLEAYRVVADALTKVDPKEKLDEARFVAQCLALGKQYQLQRRVARAESVSKVLFQTALRLAGNRGLLASDGSDLAEKRRAFAAELRRVIRRVDAIDALAASRRTGLLGRND